MKRQTCLALLILFGLGVMLPATEAAVTDVPTSLTLWYDKPATHPMTEALPIGNGRIGGVVLGGTADERFQFNEDSLWTGDANPSGNYDTMGAYQAFGDVLIHLPGHETATDYRRSLDLRSAHAVVSYRVGDITYRREYFASFPDQVIVMRLTASKPASLTGTLRLRDTHGAPSVVSGNRIAAAGALANGLKYESQVQLIPQGGAVAGAADGSAVTFSGCDSLTIFLVAGTDYTMDGAHGYRGPDPHERLARQLAAASARSFDDLAARQRRDYASLFNRVSLNLGVTSPERLALPTDKRKVLAASGGDPELEALLFQYGRYLLISCSRPGSLPANLQGLWNDSNTPPWSSDYHTDINVQMNYWLAEVTNLSECQLPLFALVDSQLPDWRKATQDAPDYKLSSGAPVRGWALRCSHNIFGGMGWDWEKTANAWYCQHFWEHYAFTGDKVFLKTTAYPVMKETCEFWQDHLKTLPDGRLVVPNGWSPEHGPHEDGVSYDQEIVWDLFTNYVDASQALGVDAAYRTKIAALRDKLVTPKIGRWGQLQEWMEDVDDPNDHHRHTSHLFGVFPGREFSVAKTPAFAAAAAKSLAARGDTGDVREWSFAWRTALWARLHEGDKAHAQMVQLFSDRNSCSNLFGLHPPMQMDGNFGITAGIAEMLLQSQDGEIDLLPALPKAWGNGHVGGLRARGGYTVDEIWKDGKLVQVTLANPSGGIATIRYGALVRKFVILVGGSVTLDSQLTLVSHGHR